MTPSAMATLLPERPASWAVALRNTTGGSDKDYRIGVRGTVTIFQWGRHGADGQVQVVDHLDAAKAQSAALRQWAAKEAKGYWPETGLLAIEDDETWTFVLQSPQAAISRLSVRVTRRLVDVEAGAHRFLVTFAEADWRRERRLVPGLHWRDERTGLCLLAVDEQGASLASQAFPLCIPLGEGDVAEAEMLVATAAAAASTTGVGRRALLAQALSVAQACFAPIAS